MSSRFRLYVSMICILIFVSSAGLNQHRQYNDANGHYVWKSTSDFIPIQSTSYGNITIGDEMSMEFDFVWNGHTLLSPEGGMFFRIGAGADLGGTGCRGNHHQYPSLWITDTDHGTSSLVLYLSEKDSCSRSYDLSSFGAITEDEPYHVVISFNMTTLVVSITEHGVPSRFNKWTRSGTPSQFIGEVVPVWWMSDKFGSTEYDPANGTFSNIIIKSMVLDPTLSVHSVQGTASPMGTGSEVVPGTESEFQSESSINGTAEMTEMDGSEYTTLSVNWSIITIAVLLSFLCFATGCCVAWFGVARAQQQRITESEIADIHRKAKGKVAASSPECAECTEFTASGTVHIVIGKTADLDPEGVDIEIDGDAECGVAVEEKEGILDFVEREDTFYSEDLYITNTARGSVPRAPSPKHLNVQITASPRHLSKAFSSDPSQFSKLRRLGEHLELPISPEASVYISDSEATPDPTEYQCDASTSLSAAYRRPIHLGLHPMKKGKSDEDKKSDGDEQRKEHNATVLEYLRESRSIGSISSYKE